MLGPFTTAQVKQITGLTIRQIDYWDRIRFIRPSIAKAKGRGSVRRYSIMDIVEMKTAKGLLEGGISLRKIKEAFQYLRKAMPHIRRPLLELRLVALPGKKFVLARDNPGYMELVDTPGQMVLFVAPVGQIAKEVEDQVEELKQAKKFVDERIEINPEVMGGAPVIAGTRIPIDTILYYLRHGWDAKKIAKEFPSLTAKDVEAARLYWELERKKGRPRKVAA